MSFIAELKRRQVLRTAAAYVAVAWLLIQVVETTFPAFGLGESAVRLVIILALLGFIPIVIASWLFQLTPEGLERDAGSTVPDISVRTKIDRAIIVLLGVGITFFAFDKFILDPQRDEEIVAQARNDALLESYGDKSIAVLAFADMSPDGNNEYFADGIAEELINLLAKIPELRVISRSSAFAYKDSDSSIPDIAEDLGVSYILEGSVRKAGDRIRVTAQLIEARSDTHLYSENFDRTIDDIFAIQDEVAARVVDSLQVHLNGDIPRARPTNPEAHALLLRAKFMLRTLTTDALEPAEELVLQSLAIDPEYLSAIHELIGIRISYATQGLRPLEDMRSSVRDLVARAFEIDPENGYTIIVSSFPDGIAVGNMPVIIDRLKKGLAKDSSHLESIQVAADALRAIGQIKRSSELLVHVVERDPLCAHCMLRIGRNYMFLQDYDKAEKWVREFRQTHPQGGTHTLGTILFLEGEYQQAVDVFAKLGEPANPASIVLHGQAMTGIMLHDAQLLEQATAELRASHYDDDPVGLAEIYALTGDHDAAFEALDHALELKPNQQMLTYQRPLLRNLHDDPRWAEFREKTGTSEEALARLAFDIEIAGEL